MLNRNLIRLTLQVFVQTKAEMTSPLVSTVNMATGAQTFAATYEVATVAGTQVLTFADAGADLGPTLGAASGTISSNSVSYANLADGEIVATLTVQDANSPAIYYTYTSNTYTTAQFKTAVKPTNLSCETLNAANAVTVSGAAPTFNGTDAQVTCEFTSADADQFISSATGSADSYATLHIDGPSSRTQKLSNAECIQAQRLPSRAYTPSTSVTVGAALDGGFMWNTAGTPFQINLLRNADVTAYSTASPPPKTTEYWNGDRASNGTGQFPNGNWVDPEQYSLKIDMAGNMNVYTNSGATVVEPATQWTITGWGQTVLRGSVDITSVPGTTRLIVFEREYRNFPAGINANPQESFDGPMYTEVAAYSFKTTDTLTTGTALTVEIDTSYTGPAGPQLFSAGSVGPSFTQQVTGAGDYVASIVSDTT